MPIWNTNEIVELCQSIADKNSLGPVKISVDGPGGDHDTSHVVITFTGLKPLESLFIAGWNVESTLDDESQWNIAEVEYVTINDGMNSNGDMASKQRRVLVFAAELTCEIKEMGFDVARHWRDLF